MKITFYNFMKKWILSLLIFLYALLTNAQVNNIDELQKFSLSYYSSNVISANYKFCDKFSSEFKSFANCNFEDVALELDLQYNFKAREYHQFNMGVGLYIGPWTEKTAFTVPFQLNISPFKQNKHISAIMELAPEIYFGEYFDLYKLRSLIGIRYTLF